jgi:DNA-binding winged helix-turn-helix (wHTH) protein/tetratricopeptide (TPR) repeat protein
MRYKFEDCTLDTRQFELSHGGVRLPLRRKVFQVLVFLIEQRDRVVSRDELLAQVWPNQCVGDETLTSCVKAARQAVGDSGRAQRVIRTVHGRGLQFVAAVTATDASIPLTTPKGSPSGLAPASHTPGLLVGREAELTTLHRWYTTAQQGMRQVGFITGEAGMGKTALVEAFVARVASEGAAWIGHGQCIDQYGTAEAYLPVLEALGRLCRGPDGAYFLAWLRQHAPSWLVQMPAVLQTEDRNALRHLAGDATQARMLRELAEALERLTAERPLLLTLEDLHWSDGATLDWLAYVARRRDPARLLVLATFRPAEARGAARPISLRTRELLVHGQATELALGTLSAADVATFVARRFGEGPFVAELAPVLHQRAEGKLLFLVTMVADLVHRGVLQHGPAGWKLTVPLDMTTVGVPESLRVLIEQQFERLAPAEQAVLEAASVAGVDFSAAAVAAGVGASVEDIDTRCAMLAQQGQLVCADGLATWPDGTVVGRYSFEHALYREVIYERIPVGCRTRLHQRIGTWEGQAYGTYGEKRAAELAMHFERGHDYRRAVYYLQQAGAHAIQRGAHREAICLLSKGLQLLTTWPDTLERAQQELAIQLALGAPLIATRGWAAPEVEQTYTRAWALCQQLEETAPLPSILLGLGSFAAGRGQLPKARELLEHALTRAQLVQDDQSLVRGYAMLGMTLLFLGELAAAHAHLEQGITLSDPQTHDGSSFPPPWEPHVTCLVYDGFALWLLGYPEQALQRSHDALTRAKQLAHPYSIASALKFAAVLHQFRRETWQTQTFAEATLALARDQRFVAREAEATRLQGWVLAMQGQEEGILLIRQGVAAARASGEVLQGFWPALLAEAYGRAGQPEAGVPVLAEAGMRSLQYEERLGEAELYRLAGELLLQAGVHPQATGVFSSDDTHVLPESPEACFLQALAIARRQQAKSLELRAAVSLGRLWQHQGKRIAAHQLVAEVYEWFTEGFDTADLQEAQALLAELAYEPPASLQGELIGIGREK